jgi:tagatose 1,6-diphosphate aldolase
VVVETARRLTPLGIDLLKAEFPLDMAEDQDETSWRQSCSDISSASQTPWILLSAAVDFETYLRQVDIACDAGASGIAVGRAVWKEAVSLSREARKDFLITTARQRLTTLHDLCKAKAKPFTDFYTPSPVTTDWYKLYGQS